MRKRVIAKLQDSVVNFREREDNCRMQHGKKDTTKSGTEKVQTRVLIDYMSNLHQKYLSEHPESNCHSRHSVELEQNTFILQAD